MTLVAPSVPPYDASLIKAALDRLDETARALERKWGVGRLRLLVDDILRAKFDRQAALLDGVLWGPPRTTGDPQIILAQIDAMQRGWLALDGTAVAAGHQPKPPEFLECLSPGGKLFVIVPDNADASLLDEHVRGRAAAVYTAEEVGRLLEAWPQIATVKQVFDGARVTEIRPRRPIDWETGDALPF
jgi:hypothetical protein